MNTSAMNFLFRLYCRMLLFKEILYFSLQIVQAQYIENLFKLLDLTSEIIFRSIQSHILICIYPNFTNLCNVYIKMTPLSIKLQKSIITRVYNKDFYCSFKICRLFFGCVLLPRSYFHFIEENLKYFKKRKMDLTQGVNMGVGSEGVSSSIFKSSGFSMPPQTEIQLLSRFFCYSKLLCSFGFWIEESFVTGFNESES